MGPDCSLRVCPQGNSWALDSSTPHSYEECSGAGLCDRASGECKCFDGFEGYSCQRRSCPNDCSGNGVCRLLRDIESSVSYSADSWDNSQIMACVCDNGYFGSDCSQRRCPTGDDPLTMCPTTSAAGMVQEIKFTLGSELTHTVESAVITNDEGMDLFGVDDAKSFEDVRKSPAYAQALVGATDAYGQTYDAPTAAKAIFSLDRTDAVNNIDVGAASLKVALENIRNYRIDKVDVDAVTTGDSTDCTDNTVTSKCPYGSTTPKVLEKRYLVTFVPNARNSANFGSQQPLTCASGYSCNYPGCSPMVIAPFLYRYAATDSSSVGMAFDSTTSARYSFYAGTSASTAAFDAVNYVKLASSSSPQLPAGIEVDDKVSSSSAKRYDIRVVVAVQDPVDGVDDSEVDVYWTKVTYGHINIMADTFEYGSSDKAGVWSAESDGNEAEFVPTLLGFTYRGFIPLGELAEIPDAPGITVEFPSRNMVSVSSNYRFFEILIKLPACKVTPLSIGDEFKDATGNSLVPVDARIENVECANRGQCNRKTGICECFSGFYGLACSQMTTIM